MELDLYTIRKETLAGGVTQSELACLDGCPMKWNLRYNNLLQLRGAWSWQMAVGNAIHEFMRDRYRGLDADTEKVRWPEIGEDVYRSNEWEMEYTFWNGVIVAMQRAYVRRYKEEETTMEYDIVEQIVSREFMGFNLIGLIDGKGTCLVDSKQFIKDHKVTTRPDLMAPMGWDMMFQFMFYSWLCEPMLKGETFDFILNVLRKPALRQTQRESYEGFVRRCSLDIIKRPDFYFVREPRPITRGAIRRFEEYVLKPKLQRLKLVRDYPELAYPIITVPDTNNCFSYNQLCEFYGICKNGWDIESYEYTQRPAKHTELIGMKQYK